MLLRKAFQKTKIFFHKTLQNLKSILFHGYQKLPKPIHCRNKNPNIHQLDQFYIAFSEIWEPGNEKMMHNKILNSSKEPTKESEEHEEESGVKNKQEERGSEAREIGSSNGGGNYVLAQKMKELEMMELNDVDHVLDIEEVLHYYSRLNCPAYLDIVDKFFMDMYSEFSLPKPSASISNSSRRLGPLKL